jgi:Family of unknown function (DUF5335)
LSFGWLVLLESVLINRKLDKAEWQPFFDFLSKQLEGMRTEIEVASLALGDQIEAEWLPLVGIVYDPRKDIVEVAVEGADQVVIHHMISAPYEIYFAEEGRRFIGLDIVDAAGTHHIVKLKDPLMLPATE